MAKYFRGTCPDCGHAAFTMGSMYYHLKNEHGYGHDSAYDLAGEAFEEAEEINYEKWQGSK